MLKHKLFIGKLMIVFIFCTAFIRAEDTIIKEKGTKKDANLVIPTKAPSIKVDVDSIVSVATKDVIKYNKSVEAKEESNRKILESNRKMLEYEKQENKLIKEVILKFKSTTKEDIQDVGAIIDSVCVKYKTPLFGKRKCIEYTSIYTIVKDGKEIKLKEIK